MTLEDVTYDILRASYQHSATTIGRRIIPEKESNTARDCNTTLVTTTCYPEWSSYSLEQPMDLDDQLEVRDL